MPLGKKIKMYYDPRGQVVKTVNPDDSLQTVFFGEVSDLANPQNYTPSPWVSFSYDANDNAQRRSSGGTGLVPASNINTPKSAEIDALGRTIKTTEHDAHDSGGGVYVDVVMEYSYDIRGNQLKVTDPNGRTAFDYKYDYANRNLWTSHIDSGISSINIDVMGKPIEAENAKSGKTLSSYDVLNRPIRLWAKDDSSASFSMRQYLIYGDDLSATGKTVQQTKDLNLYAKGWKLYDESGLVHTEDYDFKGNLLEKSRQVIKDSELLSVFNGPPVNWQVNPYIVDWTGLPVAILDTSVMVTSMTYDALNRAMNVLYPSDVNGNRKVLTPTYNNAGILRSVDFDGTEYVKEVAYDAKGQPLLTAYGNGIMTRYAYDADTFRVVRMKSEGYVYSNIANNPTYMPHAGSTKQDFAYEYDLVGNIMKLHDRTPDCGISGSVLGVDALDKVFDYDPLYRVISASGRESTNQNPNILWGTAPAAGSPNANHAQAYAQSFEYDKLGNMLKLQQTGTNSYTRNYVYDNYATDNKLSRIEGTGSPAPVYSNFSYDVNGNMLSSDTDRKYVWDAADQLRAFSIQAGTSEPSVYAQYLYSGGQRVKKIVRTTGGDYEVTVYDGAFEYMKKVSGSNTYEKNYTHVEGAATVRTGNGTLFPGDITDDVVYNLGDNIGSINVRLSSSGGLIDREEYYPFGDTSLRTFVYKRYRYVNKEKDSESGLYYYGARYYASWTCRFISVDPLAAQYAHLTPYNYAGNKPINSIDINGMQSSSQNEPQSVTSPNGTQMEVNEDNEAEVEYEMYRQTQHANKGKKFSKGNPSQSNAKFKKADNLAIAPAHKPAPTPEEPLTPIEKNPTPPGTAEKAGMVITSTIASGASAANTIANGNTEDKELKGVYGGGDGNGVKGLLSKTADGVEYVTDTNKNSADDFNLWVKNEFIFNVDESNALEFDNYEQFVVAHIMNNFVSGTGPENYYFPENGVISNLFIGSETLDTALNAYKEKSWDGSPRQFSFKGMELINDTYENNGNIFNITGLAGSTTISIVEREGGISISIFNITSLTSGTFGKEPLGPSNYPVSYVRPMTEVNTAVTVPYSNISQTFNLFLPNGSY